VIKELQIWGTHNIVTIFAYLLLLTFQLSCIISELNGDFGRKLQFFSYSMVKRRDASVLDRLAPLRHFHDSGARYK